MVIDFSIILVILNFILLLVILNAILYKPLGKFLTDRKNKIQSDLDEASLAVEKANQLVFDKELELKRTYEWAQSTKVLLKKEAENQAEQLLDRARALEQNIINDTNSKVAEIGKKAKLDIETSLSTLVADLTGKVLQEKVDTAKDKELITKLLAGRSG
jgi:F-type H+-transporting ATPase subunit b